MRNEKKKEPMKTVSASIPAPLDALLEKEANRQRRSKAAIIRFILGKYGTRAVRAA